MVTRNTRRIIIALSGEEAEYLRHLLSVCAETAEIDGAAFLPSGSRTERLAGAALLRRVAGRIEQVIGCPECGQLNAHAARCSLRNPERD